MENLRDFPRFQRLTQCKTLCKTESTSEEQVGKPDVATESAQPSTPNTEENHSISEATSAKPKLYVAATEGDPDYMPGAGGQFRPARPEEILAGVLLLAPRDLLLALHEQVENLRSLYGGKIPTFDVPAGGGVVPFTALEGEAYNGLLGAIEKLDRSLMDFAHGGVVKAPAALFGENQQDDGLPIEEHLTPAEKAMLKQPGTKTATTRKGAARRG